MKHGWVMYLFIVLLAGVMLRNAAGAVGLMLAGGQVGTNFVGALEGPAGNQKGTFTFGANKVVLG